MGKKIINKEINLGVLPLKSNRIDWSNSVGYEINFLYDEVDGIIKIIKYDNSTKYLTVEWNGKNKMIHISNFKDGKLGCIIGKKTIDFKIDIMTVFSDYNRNIVITSREYRKAKNNQNLKWYQYLCNNCNQSHWAIETSILRGSGCPNCIRKFVNNETTNLSITNPWILKSVYNSDIEYYKKKQKTKKNIIVTCPECGYEKLISVKNRYKKKFSCPICADGISYPEKFMSSLLMQLNVIFIRELNKRHYDWCDTYRYDFYLPNSNSIIETHGLQHYEESQRGKSLLDEHENDRSKEFLAKKNNIKNYIVIDSRYSELEFIKKSIMNSVIPKLLNFNVDDVDWVKCEKDACSSLITQVCLFKSEHEHYSSAMIGEHFNLCKSTIIKYLKIGDRYGWCTYDLHQIKIDATASRPTKSIDIFKKGEYLGRFPSVSKLIEESMFLFGVTFNAGGISNACHNKVPSYKGFTFKYIVD